MLKEWLAQLTPPEWGDWNLWGRLAYVVTYSGLMALVWWGAHWLARLL